MESGFGVTVEITISLDKYSSQQEEAQTLLREHSLGITVKHQAGNSNYI